MHDPRNKSCPLNSSPVEVNPTTTRLDCTCDGPKTLFIADEAEISPYLTVELRRLQAETRAKQEGLR